MNAAEIRLYGQEMLASMVPDAIEELYDIMTGEGKDADKLRAIESVLDRTGHPRRTETADGTVQDMIKARIQAMLDGDSDAGASDPAPESGSRELLAGKEDSGTVSGDG